MRRIVFGAVPRPISRPSALRQRGRSVCDRLPHNLLYGLLRLLGGIAFQIQMMPLSSLSRLTDLKLHETRMRMKIWCVRCSPLVYNSLSRPSPCLNVLPQSIQPVVLSTQRILTAVRQSHPQIQKVRLSRMVKRNRRNTRHRKNRSKTRATTRRVGRTRKTQKGGGPFSYGISPKQKSDIGDHTKIDPQFEDPLF